MVYPIDYEHSELIFTPIPAQIWCTILHKIYAHSCTNFQSRSTINLVFHIAFSPQIVLMTRTKNDHFFKTPMLNSSAFSCTILHIFLAQFDIVSYYDTNHVFHACFSIFTKIPVHLSVPCLQKISAGFCTKFVHDSAQNLCRILHFSGTHSANTSPQRTILHKLSARFCT